MEVRHPHKAQMHRRKSSKDEDENVVVINDDVPPPTNGIPLNINGNGIGLGPPPLDARTRVNSTPNGHSRSQSHSLNRPPSAGPFRTGFGPLAASNGINGHPPSSPFRSSFAIPIPSGHSYSHSRTHSMSGPYSPPLPSPLSSSFPSSPPATASPTMHAFPMTTSMSAPDTSSNSNSQPQNKSRRHSRLHSRNLSVFFPRPGSLPQTTISEDGSQELELHVDEEAPAPVSDMPSAGRNLSLPSSRNPPTPLGANFSFGGRPSAGLPMPPPMTPSSSSSSSSRRGHHHKHSMSHQFFSFLEPGSGGPMHPNDEQELVTQPTPIPVSPWTPISPFPKSAGPTSTTFSKHPQPSPPSHSHSHTHTHTLTESHSHSHVHAGETSESHIAIGAAAVVVGQFLLGAWLWVLGQQIGSLSCTGLGYWVVFDAFGVGVVGVIPGWLGSNAGGDKQRIRRPYGNARVETVLMFAQGVYLMFSSVYVCKETFEHLLLSAGSTGGAEGHHHHHGDEDGEFGIDFPVFLMFVTLMSLLGTALRFNNHYKLVNITDNRIPSPSAFIRSLSSRTPQHAQFVPAPTTTASILLSNPYIASPLFFCISILLVALFVDPSQHRTCDLVLASLITVITFNVAYRASVVLGTVLLQTSPQRGLSGGKMEAFLRAMREVERHPQVLHLPAPHIWQLTPSHHSVSSSNLGLNPRGPAESLVVTLELHVREDLADDDVLALTKWAWERCIGALRGGYGRGKVDDGYGHGSDEAEVTVGVVRG